MTNETNNVEVAEVVRKTPVVAEYMELLKNKDEEACMAYLKECFGDPTSEDLDKEAFENFSKAIMDATLADAGVEVEAAKEDVAVAEEVTKDEASA